MKKRGKKQFSKLDEAVNEEIISLYNQVFIEGNIFEIIPDKFDESEFCKKKNIDVNYFDEMYSKVSPLIDKALKEEPLIYNLKVQHEMIRVLKTSRDNWETLKDLYQTDIEKIKENISEKKKSILNLIHYFFLIESIYSHYMDIIIFTLTSLHHDYYSFQGKYIKEFSDIRKTRLFDKINFLNHHGLEIITKGINRDLRNSIAHSLFSVDDDGSINIIDKDDKIDMQKAINDAYTTIITIEGVIQKCESEFMIYASKQVERIISEYPVINPTIQDPPNNEDV